MTTSDITRLRKLESTVRKYVEALDAEDRDFDDKVGALAPGQMAPVLGIATSEDLLEQIRQILAEGQGTAR